MTDLDINATPARDRKGTKRGGRHYLLPNTSLSLGETKVCQLLVNGLTVKEVALRLNISIRTAWLHTQNTYQKLGIHQRGELVRHFAKPNVNVVRDTLTDSMSPIPPSKKAKIQPPGDGSVKPCGE
jgi:DNA-binding CsgD family transcriptional regulator